MATSYDLKVADNSDLRATTIRILFNLEFHGVLSAIGLAIAGERLRLICSGPRSVV